MRLGYGDLASADRSARFRDCGRCGDAGSADRHIVCPQDRHVLHVRAYRILRVGLGFQSAECCERRSLGSLRFCGDRASGRRGNCYVARCLTGFDRPASALDICGVGGRRGGFGGI